MGHSRPKIDTVFDGQLAARNFERDDGAVEKSSILKKLFLWNNYR